MQRPTSRTVAHQPCENFLYSVKSLALMSGAVRVLAALRAAPLY